MTLAEAAALRHGQTVYHCSKRNADGTPMRARVMGRVKLWKRNPARIEVPMKHGMYDPFRLNEGQLSSWSLDEERAARGCREAGVYKIPKLFGARARR
jgi:hypothetical protein